MREIPPRQTGDKTGYLALMKVNESKRKFLPV